LVEEFIYAKVWSLAAGWLPRALLKIKVGGLKETVQFPRFDLVRPEGKTDETIVEEVGREVAELVGPFLSKEFDSFMVCCLEGVQVNLSF
jgi:hypothetical protein